LYVTFEKRYSLCQIDIEVLRGNIENLGANLNEWCRIRRGSQQQKHRGESKTQSLSPRKI
jgi:hypothetical protein